MGETDDSKRTALGTARPGRGLQAAFSSAHLPPQLDGGRLVTESPIQGRKIRAGVVSTLLLAPAALSVVYFWPCCIF